MQDLETLVTPLLHLCREAGELICSHYHAPGDTEVQTKEDQSPLTRADTESHHCLQQGLLALTPELPILSEESSPEALQGRRDWRRFWLVDPLDGTKEFLTGTGEFTINIALIEDHRPLLGVLYTPLDRSACVGIPGRAALRYREQAPGQWLSEPLATASLEPGRDLVVLASRRHRNTSLQACLDWLQQQWGPISRLDSGSALKFCQLARGEGDFYPRFSPCSEWDTAAGQAVLEAAGGALLNMAGQPLRYNCRDSLLSPYFYAVADKGHPLWRALLAENLGG